MDKREILEKLFKYIDDKSEWDPNSDELKWKNGKLLQIGRINYKITDKMISCFRSAMDVVDLIEKESAKPYIKVYTISDKSRVRIGITDGTIKRAIGRQLFRFLKKENSVFDDFIDPVGVKVSLVACIKKDADIKKTIRSLERKYGVKRSITEPYLREYNNIVTTVQPDLNKDMGVAFVLRNKTDGKCFVGGSKTEIDKKKIVRSIAMSVPDIKRDLKILKHSFTFKIIEQVEYATDLELKIKLDSISERYDSIENGYNKKMRYVKNKLNPDTLFLDANREFAYKKVSDTYDYEGVDGFIYVVRNLINNKKYINSGKGVIKDIIDFVYSGKASKSLLEDLKKYPFSDFEFEIVKFRRNKDIDLNIEVGRLIERYKTDENGYN